MTLYNMLIGAGLADDIDHHESDLYVYVSPESTAVINKWLRENGYSGKAFLSTFTDQLTGRAMYDVPFQYDPWWVDRRGRE